MHWPPGGGGRLAFQVPVLLVGSGGREHALSWKLAQSPLCDTLYCAPGNAGIAAEPGVETVPGLDINQHDKVVAWCKEKDIGLVTVGPEAPLVAGLVDALRAGGIRVFGPTASAARLEGSKSFLKELCRDFGIPTAAFQRFSDAAAAKAYIQGLGAPIVVKADGLAAGKGVVVAHSVEEACAAVDDMLLRGKFGAAGAEIVVEEFLEGEEASFFALVDGTICVPLASAQDHKAAWEGDRGPNTGGMGAYSPAPAVTAAVEAQVMAEIVQRTADAMAQQGAPFQGVLFAGLMIRGGRAKLLEHNVRFGDPECQALMARLDSDLLPLLLAAAEGRLASAQPPAWSTNAALTVVLAAHGYPGPYASGSVIRGLDAVRGAKVFHAGTALNTGGEVVAAGGRVLGVTATGTTVAAAQRAAYQAVDAIDWPEGYCRRDIGWRAA